MCETWRLKKTTCCEQIKEKGQIWHFPVLMEMASWEDGAYRSNKHFTVSTVNIRQCFPNHYSRTLPRPVNRTERHAYKIPHPAAPLPDGECRL